MAAPAHGSLLLVLHAHLPFVRHPEHPVFLEENWFFEALLESYLPLLATLRRLAADGVETRLTLSLSPTLCEMLRDGLLRERFRARLAALIEVSEREAERTRDEPAFHRTATLYRDRFRTMRRLYEETCGGDPLAEFARLEEAGAVELIACAATHAFLPLIGNETCRRAQIRAGAANFQKHFGRPPRGMWLPECAFVPGMDDMLAEAGIRFFFLDTHGVAHATPRPRYAFFAPVACRGGSVAFGRDIESSKQVWSATSGYPGDPDYREFYRDLGFDAEPERIGPLRHPDGIRHDTGIKYFRVTGDVPLHEKAPYDPDAAATKANLHAENFLHNRLEQIRRAEALMDRPPAIVAPFDAELFGHWWFEGPLFLDRLFRRRATIAPGLRPLTPSQYLERFPENQAVEPSTSSWGDKGYFEVWLNGANDWIYPLLHAAEERMCALARRFASPTPLEERALNQAARELMLAESSDWAFILTTDTVVEYARGRLQAHLDRFDALHAMLAEGRPDAQRLERIEEKDRIFDEMDWRLYRD